MGVGEFLKPDKKKIGVAIATALIYFNTYLVLRFQLCISGNTACIFAWSFPALLSFFLLELYYMLWAMLFYPFACSIVTLYEARTDIRSMKNKTAVIVGLIFFNPFVIVMLVTQTSVWILFG